MGQKGRRSEGIGGCFLCPTEEYPAFVKRMHRELQHQEADAKLPEIARSRQLSKESTCSSRPETHWGDEASSSCLVALFRRCQGLMA